MEFKFEQKNELGAMQHKDHSVVMYNKHVGYMLHNLRQMFNKIIKKEMLNGPSSLSTTTTTLYRRTVQQWDLKKYMPKQIVLELCSVNGEPCCWLKTMSYIRHTPHQVVLSLSSPNPSQDGGKWISCRKGGFRFSLTDDNISAIDMWVKRAIRSARSTLQPPLPLPPLTTCV
jgi:hypothetical protein